MNKQIPKIPSIEELMVPTVRALIGLGGSGNIEEINEKVYEIANISEAILQIPHSGDTRSAIEYRLAWSRTFLKNYGLLENSARGVWTLTNPNVNVEKLDYKEIVATVRAKDKSNGKPKSLKKLKDIITEEVAEFEDWREELLNTLYNISPAAFERLSQRILRESGFMQVEVTGKVGDGGIDGKGIVKIGGLITFPILFQCKRYRGSVTPSQVRDFRGAMQGRVDRGLIITTGSFTREAEREAKRDGVPPIDLIDGEALCDKLRELLLGVRVKLIESVEIDSEWFSRL